MMIRFDGVIGVGGDGVFNEVVEGLLRRTIKRQVMDTKSKYIS